MPKVAGLILSAGESKRMGEPKALLTIDNHTLLEDQISRLKKAGIHDIFVVVGAHRDEILGQHEALDVNWATNESWQSGNFSSILCGLRKTYRSSEPRRDEVPLRGKSRTNNTNDFTGTILLPVDVAGVETKTIRRIIDEGVKRSQNIIPTYNGRGGHPVYLTKAFAKQLLDQHTNNDRLDVIFKKDKDTTRLEVDTKTILNNINTREEWDNI